eukprot:TRINITY_DN17069_c0_g2_i1.p1 TRINITY_DN17069_c0_g2~~TRINITY_DN17069_c0_g2_i1.p1  ORF type:complete len:195 (+),score=7.42 TRINITY_DN17069_c0_g2_i1:386-970(+)
MSLNIDDSSCIPPDGMAFSFSFEFCYTACWLRIRSHQQTDNSPCPSCVIQNRRRRKYKAREANSHPPLSICCHKHGDCKSEGGSGAHGRHAPQMPCTRPCKVSTSSTAKTAPSKVRETPRATPKWQQSALPNKDFIRLSGERAGEEGGGHREGGEQQNIAPGGTVHGPRTRKPGSAVEKSFQLWFQPGVRKYDR